MTVTTQIRKPKSATPRKLGIRSVIGYGAGDLANNLAFTLSTTFLLLYYTDVVGLPAAAIGTMFLVVRLWMPSPTCSPAG